MLTTLACSKGFEQTEDIGEYAQSSHIFKKGETLQAGDPMVLEISQSEAPEYDLSVQQEAPPPPPPPVVTNKDPLIIQISANSKLQLSNPFQGVLFDIFGDNFSGGKFRVSWPLDDNFGFLVLPNKDGQVPSIHELFGDGTLGPDGYMALNGYDALEKYDGLLSPGVFSLGQRNKVIDKNDVVFSKLRIWLDKNHNGVAEASELTSLDQSGIRAISLRYDSKYSEKDEFGNIIAFKSKIVSSDGSDRVMFNLWLRYINF